MKMQEAEQVMGRFYEKKWQNHKGFWLDIYKPHQHVYAQSLYVARNRYILDALP